MTISFCSILNSFRENGQKWIESWFAWYWLYSLWYFIYRHNNFLVSTIFYFIFSFNPFIIKRSLSLIYICSLKIDILLSNFHFHSSSIFLLSSPIPFPFKSSFSHFLWSPWFFTNIFSFLSSPCFNSIEGSLLPFIRQSNTTHHVFSHNQTTTWICW